jgi:hypothetical protein
MSFKNRMIQLACLLASLTLVGAGTANAATYLLTGGSGGGLQIGTGLPLPAAPIFLGGMTVGMAGTFPPVGVPPVLAASTMAPLIGKTKLISQNLATGLGGTIVIPSGVLSIAGGGTVAVFTTNPAVFQVATSISFGWPSATATLSPGGAPGPAVLGTGTVGGFITYSGGTKSFGGPGQFTITAGPLAGTKRIPPNGMGVVPIATVWINVFGAPPAGAMTVLIVGASAPLGVGQPGAPVASPPGTTMFGVVGGGASNFGGVNISTTMGFMCCTLGAFGTIPSSIAAPGPPLSNMVTGSKGFPWSTGLITVSQPAAVPPEVFFLSGTDMRVGGVGNVSLVSGALSSRALSGPNANRGWISLTLPEPTAALGSLGALVMLGVCHGLVRRRSR